MSDNFISFDDILKSQQSFISFDDILQQPFVPLHQIFDLSQQEQQLRLKTMHKKRSILDEITGSFEQLGVGIAQEATLGVSKYALGEVEPQSVAESLARGIGQFAGFLLTPLKIGKLGAKGLTKVLPKVFKSLAPKIGEKAAGQIIRGAQYGVKNVATLGIAEAVSDITELEKAPERLAHGMKLGAIFGATGLAHVYQHKNLSWLMRQFGGRALLKVMGEYPEEYLSSENLPNAIFSEALFTYFFTHGISPSYIRTGKIPEVEVKRLAALQTEIDQANKEYVSHQQLVFGKEYFPGTEKKPLPTILEAMQRYGGKSVTSERMQQILGTSIFKYNLQSELLLPELITPVDAIKPRANDLVFKIRKDVPELVLRGKAAEKLSPDELAKLVPKIQKKINEIKAVPNKPLAESVQREIASRVSKLNLGIYADNITPFYRALGIKDKPVNADLIKIGRKLTEVSKAPYGQEIDVLLREFKDREKLPHHEAVLDIPNPEIKEWYQTELDYLNKKRGDKLAKTKGAMIFGKKTGSPLVNILSPSWLREWMDSRKFFEKVQRDTGIPLWDIRNLLSRGEGEAKKATNTYMKRFEKFKKFEKDDEIAVQKYFQERYDAYDKYTETELPEIYEGLKARLSSHQRDYVDTVDALMTEVAPFVRKYRFMSWYNSYVENKYDISKTAKIFRNQKDLQDLLVEGARIYEARGENHLDQWLETRAPGLGLIERGNYLPAILIGRFYPKEHQEFGRFVDAMPKSHLQARASQELMDEVFLSFAPERPLNARLNNYVRQVMNLTHLEPHLKSLDNLIDVFEPYFHAAKGKPILGMIGGGKSYSLLEYLRLLAHRYKGYPVKIGGLGRLAKAIQSMFFRALTVNPFLWLRNTFQQFTTMPMKSLMVKRGRFKNIPEEYKERFDTDVSQFASFDHYLFLEVTKELERFPLFKVAEKVGRTYALTDLVNRQRVFAKTWFNTKRNIIDYQNKKIDFKTLVKNLGIEHMDEPLERMRVMKLASQGQLNEASFYAGKWMSDNSQWIYKRSGKGLHEITGEGEAFTNLLTWTKGITQRVSRIFTNFQEGYERKNYSQMWGASKELMGLGLVSLLASEVLNTVSVSHGRKYRDYAWDMFVWEFGGVTFGIAKDLTEKVGEVVTAFDAPPDEQRRAFEDLLRYMDNIVVRQMIPFAKQTLSIAEALTDRAYISPLYNFITKKGITKVDRTIVESFTHAILAKDPNKSAFVRKDAHRLKQVWQSKMMRTDNPILKKFYEGMYKRYDYLSDLYLRYEPVEVFERYQEREYKKFFEAPDLYDIAYKQERKMKLMERKAGMGY